MGFLSSTDVHECSATDLIAGFVGQTGLKTVEVLNEALGAVLFIDEAYRLGEGHFATEAVNTLVDSLTKPTYMGKMLVVLAGYEGNMNELLKVNPGLSSRFPEEIVFQNMSPENALELLKQKLRKSDIEIETANYDEIMPRVIAALGALSKLPSWGNGRDVETLAKIIARATFQSANDDLTKDFLLTLTELEKHVNVMLRERIAREAVSGPLVHTIPPVVPMANSSMTTKPPETSISTNTSTDGFEPKETDAVRTVETSPDSTNDPQEQDRDPGVPENIWAQLMRDKATAEALAKRRSAHIATLSQTAQLHEAKMAESTTELANIEAQMKEKSDSDELKRRHEELRLKRLRLLLAKREAEDRLRRAQEEADAARKQEVKAQEKLRCMGICPAGFRWIKQSGGYRCSAGGHFVGNKELGFDG